jgi:replicative DNA helicase
MKTRHDFGLLKPLVHAETLSAETAALLVDFERYFNLFPSHEVIDLTTFLTRFPTWHKGITEDKLREYAMVMKNVMPEPDEDQRAAILSMLADNDVSIKLGNILAEWQEGDVSDLMGQLGQTMDKYRLARGVKSVKFIDTPIKELLKDDFDDNGIRWRLGCLNSAMRPLRGGDFGIIAGRPDKGKTSFIASETTFMAPQLPEDRNVLWLNNEGPGKRIIPRVWQATLGYTMAEMKAMAEADKLEEQFLARMGRFDKFRIVDIHGMNNSQVEMIIESNNPGIVVYDMIDNIAGFGDAARTDLKLESMYGWARERCVKYDHIGLATSQISSEGDNLKFPGLSMLKDSKTGKQGACDFQLMIGNVDNPMMQMSRFIGLPKNKLRRPDGPGDPKAEVIFDMLRSQFKDMQIDPSTGINDIGSTTEGQQAA